MSEETFTLFPGCVLSALYVWIPYLLSCSVNELHLADIPVRDPPLDLRLHDYQLRHHLDGFCLTQAIRTVHAVRHTAYHFADWSSRTGSNSIEDFTCQTFGSQIDTEEVRGMVIDGQRLDRLEHQCRNAYIGLVVALDWRRFQTTSDARLVQLGGDLLCLPAVQHLLVLLRPEWPRESFGHYHEETVRFRLMTLTGRWDHMYRSLRCDGCTQFPRTVDRSSFCCVGCQRGGFPSYSGSTSCHTRPDDDSSFLAHASQLLRRAHWKCDHLMAGRGTQNPVSMPQATQVPTTIAEVVSPATHPRISNHTILEAIADMDQKLTVVQQRASRTPCECCRQKKVKCTRSAMSGDSHAKDIRPRRSFSGRFRTLLPVTEEPVENHGRHNEAEASSTT